ncbi:propanediol utilization protein PduB, partial [Listeria innocua FSL S4-378]
MSEQNKLIDEILKQVMETVNDAPEKLVEDGGSRQMSEKAVQLTEFVGTAIGDTIGLVIANVDGQLLEAMKLEKSYRSIGILGARTGAGPHIMAADEAVK